MRTQSWTSWPVRARRRLAGDRGQSTLELVAVVPVVLLLAGILLQLAAVTWAITDVTDAARHGARASSQGNDGCAAARNALSGRLAADMTDCDHDRGTVTITVRAPILVSGFEDVDIRRTAELPDLRDR